MKPLIRKYKAQKLSQEEREHLVMECTGAVMNCETAEEMREALNTTTKLILSWICERLSVNVEDDCRKDELVGVIIASILDRRSRQSSLLDKEAMSVFEFVRRQQSGLVPLETGKPETVIMERFTTEISLYTELAVMLQERYAENNALVCVESEQQSVLMCEWVDDALPKVLTSGELDAVEVEYSENQPLRWWHSPELCEQVRKLSWEISLMRQRITLGLRMRKRRWSKSQRTMVSSYDLYDDPRQLRLF